jgi:hypothetical protein
MIRDIAGVNREYHAKPKTHCVRKCSVFVLQQVVET